MKKHTTWKMSPPSRRIKMDPRQLYRQFISPRRLSPLDSHRSDMTDQDKLPGSKVRSIQCSSCPQQEQKAGLSTRLNSLPCSFTVLVMEIRGTAHMPLQKNQTGLSRDFHLLCSCASFQSSPAGYQVCLFPAAWCTSTCPLDLRPDFPSAIMNYLTFQFTGFEGLHSARVRKGLESSSATVLLSPHPGQRLHYAGGHGGQVEVCAFASNDDTNKPKEAFRPGCIDPTLR